MALQVLKRETPTYVNTDNKNKDSRQGSKYENQITKNKWVKAEIKKYSLTCK